jgi:F-type H+-transporting ATPase subunit epsilon
MAKFHFELVSPERVLFTGEVDQVDIPGSEGDFGVLAGHAPLVARVRPGVLIIRTDGNDLRMAVRGGLAEIANDNLTMLAEYAIPVEDIDLAMLGDAIKDAEEDLADATDEAVRSKIHRRLEQLRLLKDELEDVVR